MSMDFFSLVLPEAKVQTMVRSHLHRLICGANDVRTRGDKNQLIFNFSEITFRVKSFIEMAAKVTHHLWYLHVSAPLTSSVIAAGSLMSSMIMTKGSSPPHSLSIWFARFDRYICKSCQREEMLVFFSCAYKISDELECYNAVMWHLVWLTVHIEGDSRALSQKARFLLGRRVRLAALPEVVG